MLRYPITLASREDNHDFSRENITKSSGKSGVVSTDTTLLVVSRLQQLIKLSILWFFLDEILMSFMKHCGFMSCKGW